VSKQIGVSLYSSRPTSTVLHSDPPGPRLHLWGPTRFGGRKQRCRSGKLVRVILDNYATHKHPKVRAWLKRHPRFVFHFTPTSSSWLNAVEGYFAKLTRRRSTRADECLFLGKKRSCSGHHHNDRG
jgi:DDE superfamily endonuclease